MPLTLKESLPDGALVDGAARNLAASLRAGHGAWFRAVPDALLTDETFAVTGWRPEVGATPARPAQPNTGHSFWRQGNGMSGLAFVAEKNCGFAVEGQIAALRSFSVAVRYGGAVGGMRTLVAAGFRKGAGYLFLAENETEVIFRDRDHSVGVALPVPSEAPGPRHVVAGVSGGRLWLSAGGRVAQAPCPDTAVPKAAADLFIGCRSDRGGLPKSLGAGLIDEVLVWPVNILDPAAPGAAAMAAAYAQHRFWGD